MAKRRLEWWFNNRSPDLLTDQELLTLLLKFCSENPAEIASRLIAQYADIANLMEANFEDLSSIEELDGDTILLLRLVPELHRRYFLTRSRDAAILLNSADYGRYLLPYFYGTRDEMVYLLMLDGACRVINCRLLGQGSVNSANVPIRKLVQEAINANASGIVIAHNHPSGVAMPSPEDVAVTVSLAEALSIMDITLLDHIIIADDDYVSLRESGYLYR